MNKDWTRDPIWQTMGVIIAAAGLVALVIVTPSLPLIVLVVVSFCVCGALFIARGKESHKDDQGISGSVEISNTGKAPSRLSTKPILKRPDLEPIASFDTFVTTPEPAPRIPPRLSKTKRWWLTACIDVLDIIFLFSATLIGILALMAIIAIGETWRNCKSGCFLQPGPGASLSDIAVGAAFFIVILIPICVATAYGARRINKTFLLNHPLIIVDELLDGFLDWLRAIRKMPRRFFK